MGLVPKGLGEVSGSVSLAAQPARTTRRGARRAGDDMAVILLEFPWWRVGGEGHLRRGGAVRRRGADGGRRWLCARTISVKPWGWFSCGGFLWYGGAMVVVVGVPRQLGGRVLTFIGGRRRRSLIADARWPVPSSTRRSGRNHLPRVSKHGLQPEVRHAYVVSHVPRIPKQGGVPPPSLGRSSPGRGDAPRPRPSTSSLLPLDGAKRRAPLARSPCREGCFMAP